MDSKYILIPVISALIGWTTNYIAIKMLFRPRKGCSFLGFTIQGLVPKRQRQLAASIGETVGGSLLRHEDVTQLLSGDAVKEAIKKEIDSQIELFLTKLTEVNPMVGMVVQGPMGAQVKSLLIEQLEKAIPQFLSPLTAVVESELSFSDLVRTRIEQLDLSALEALIQRISSNELKTIEILGGVLGFLIGIVQVFLV